MTRLTRPDLDDADDVPAPGCGMADDGPECDGGCGATLGDGSVRLDGELFCFECADKRVRVEVADRQAERAGLWTSRYSETTAHYEMIRKRRMGGGGRIATNTETQRRK